ncbi:MAG: CehA/McbA family metallohydrolase [Thermoplasmata archaeon]
MYKIDLHVHTIYSVDSAITPEEIISYCKIKNLDGVAITDHNTLEGFNTVGKIIKKAGLIVIPGEEISTSQGHLIALFINEKIERGMDYIESIKRIHMQHGIAIAPHPYRSPHKVYKKELLENIDGIETINGRSSNRENRKAKKLAMNMNLPGLGGSDCHNAPALGNAYTVIYSPSSTLESIYDNILKGNCTPAGNGIAYYQKVPLWIGMAKKWALRRGKSL